MIMKQSIFYLAIVAILSISSCGKKGAGPTAPGGGNQDSVLVNLGDNIILPSYRNLTASVDALDSAIADFNTSPAGDKLTRVQALFATAYTAWEATSEYNGFGPAYSVQPILSSLDVFPADTTTIEGNVTAGNDNVNTFSNTAAKGFPALDYLLYAKGLSAYTTDAGASGRRGYLSAVSADIKAETGAALNGWEAAGGNYIKTFVEGAGNSISSSLGLLINSMDQDFEILKNDRLGIPLGKQPPGQALPVLPKELEGYYSGLSARLALAQLRAVQSLYLGTGSQGSGPGLQAYLIQAKAAYNGGLLSDTIRVRFAQAVSDMQALTDPLSAQIQTNPQPADVVYADIQQLVVLLKTDMPSSLGVLITYGDNDGD
jgi:uncharacterized protein